MGLSSSGSQVSRLLAPALLAAIALTPARAWAVDSNDARLAQALFEEARQLMAQKRYAEACPKLEESQRRDPGGGTLLNLALCHESEGKIATAYVEYTEALAGATRDKRRDREVFARTHISAIEAQVPRLTVVVRPEAVIDGLEIAFDGTPLPRAAWGVATPVDPGAHTVSASAPGRTRWTATLSLLAGEKKSVEVPAPAPAEPAVGGVVPSPVSQAPAPAPVSQPPAPQQDVVTSEPEPPRTRANPVYYGVLGVTAAAAATMLVTGVLAVGARTDAEEGCLRERSFCRDAASKDAAESAGTYAWVSTGALVVTLFSAGALLFIPSRKSASPNARAPGLKIGLGSIGGAF